MGVPHLPHMLVAQTLPLHCCLLPAATAEPLPQIRRRLAFAGDEKFQDRRGPKWSCAKEDSWQKSVCLAVLYKTCAERNDILHNVN